MTTIFWHKNHVYADSNIVDGKDEFASLTKVRALRKPVKIQSKSRGLQDVIYGFVVTGALIPADELMITLISTGEIDMIENVYALVANLKLVNFENHFEIIFIGGKANYRFRLPVDDEPVFHIYQHKDNFALGTGASRIKTIVSEFPHPNPIRLMYAVYCRDTSSRGMIDVWRLSKTRKGTYFERVGICRGLEDRNPAELISDMYAPYPYDWKVNPRALTRVRYKPEEPTPAKRLKERIPSLREKL